MCKESVTPVESTEVKEVKAEISKIDPLLTNSLRCVQSNQIQTPE